MTLLQNNGQRASKIAICGVLSSLALILGYIETLVGIPIVLPGIKLGLANIVIVFALYYVGEKEAFYINIVRIVVGGFMFGSISGIIYAISGGLFSYFIMVLGKKKGKFSIIGVSILGAVFHNIGQILVASLVVSNILLLYYIPVLTIAGVFTGIVIGGGCYMVLSRVR